jgi:N-methylhydantoinase B
MMMRERRVTQGVYGAGEWRAGAALSHVFEPYGADQLVGQMIGTRGRLPLNGEAGGFPGAVTHFSIRERNGKIRPVDMAGADASVLAGERFEVSSASAGGWGDPLLRPAERVLEDILRNRVTAADAKQSYGVIVEHGRIDEAATEQIRRELRLARLDRATAPASRPQAPDLSKAVSIPLYPGVLQKGRFAVAAGSGAVLAEAPNHWTDGCAIIEDETDGVLRRIYLDPTNGDALLVESAPAGSPRAFATLPDHWVKAA